MKVQIKTEEATIPQLLRLLECLAAEIRPDSAAENELYNAVQTCADDALGSVPPKVAEAVLRRFNTG